jgi:hypothetical protein
MIPDRMLQILGGFIGYFVQSILLYAVSHLFWEEGFNIILGIIMGALMLYISYLIAAALCYLVTENTQDSLIPETTWLILNIITITAFITSSFFIDFYGFIFIYLILIAISSMMKIKTIFKE